MDEDQKIIAQEKQKLEAPHPAAEDIRHEITDAAGIEPVSFFCGAKKDKGDSPVTADGGQPPKTLNSKLTKATPKDYFF